jgi:hypothetical protein
LGTLKKCIQFFLFFPLEKIDYIDKNPLMQKQDLPKVKIQFDQTTPIKCGKCEGEVFQMGFSFRRASKFLTGNPKDVDIPFQVVYCTSCGTINKDIDLSMLTQMAQ